MLSKITIENFRCFGKSTIPLKDLTVVVGANNAGKSTLIEALRLVSLVTNRLGRLPFHPVPDWLDLPLAYRGVSPSTVGQPLKFRGEFHQYNEPPAKITAHFQNGCSIEVYLGEQGRLHAVCLDSDGNLVTTQAKANAMYVGRIAILPQIGPVRDEETALNSEYVRASLDSNLASLHFRNQIMLLYSSNFDEFKSLAEGTWPTLRIEEVRGGGPSSEPLELLVRNQDFVGEISLMGHGLQMWLQTMWFVARSLGSETLILDEPDVYMHADLQRRLIRFLRRRTRQLIVATHSVEIMGEVEPENVLVIDRGRRRARFASDLASLNEVVQNIGGIHNLQLARLWNAKRCLFVEGRDVSILKRIEDTLFPESPETMEVLPRISVGGWGGWAYVIGSSMLLDKNVGSDFIKYCLFDRDYHLGIHIEERYVAARKNAIDLHVWDRKEIENYLLSPSAIGRLIRKRAGRGAPSDDKIQSKIDQITETMEDEVLDAFSQEQLSVERAGGVAKANEFARKQVSDWGNPKTRASIASGKKIISRLSDWAKRKYDLSFGPEAIAAEMSAAEIPQELADVVSSIHEGERLPTPRRKK